jgi:TonB family protein
VLRITRALNPEFRRCYQQELVANPGAKGRADVTLTIAPEGRVSKVQVELSGNLSQNARGCVASAVRKAQFEPAAEEATVKLPILLQSG